MLRRRRRSTDSTWIFHETILNEKGQEMEQLQPWFQVDLYITVHFIDCLHVSKTKKTTLWSIASSLRHLGGL